MSAKMSTKKTVVAKLTAKFESDVQKFFVWAVEKEYVIKDIDNNELEWSLDLLKTINFVEPGRNKLEGFIAAVKDTYNVYRGKTKVDDAKLLAKDFKEAPVEKKTKTTKKEKAESSDEAPKKVKKTKAKKESDDEEVDEVKPVKKATKAKKVDKDEQAERELLKAKKDIVKTLKKTTKAKKVVEESESEVEEPKKTTKTKAKKVVKEESESEVEKPKKKTTKAKKVVEESESEVEKPKKKTTKAKKVVEESESEVEKPKKKATKAKVVEEEIEDDQVKVDMTLDTLDTENLDTLDYWTSDLVKAFGKPKKTGGDDEDHLYEWKIQVNNSIFSIYDWHNDQVFDDITWHISGNGSYEKNEKNLNILTAYIDEFCSKKEIKLDFENLGESDEEADEEVEADDDEADADDEEVEDDE
jgi:chemotaxis protein histidine kinase CheA